MIMFCLVNIPTIRSVSSHERRGLTVKKWDKRAIGLRCGLSIPNCACLGGRFSKTGRGGKFIGINEMGVISTFQAQTTTATSIFFFSIVSLEAVAPLDRGLGRYWRRTQSTLVSTKKSIALEVGSPLESSRRRATKMHRVLDSVYSLASDNQLKPRRYRP
jgi:hypothetical protein